jgi:hypothetical protein
MSNYAPKPLLYNKLLSGFFRSLYDPRYPSIANRVRSVCKVTRIPQTREAKNALNS